MKRGILKSTTLISAALFLGTFSSHKVNAIDPVSSIAVGKQALEIATGEPLAIPDASQMMQEKMDEATGKVSETQQKLQERIEKPQEMMQQKMGEVQQRGGEPKLSKEERKKLKKEEKIKKKEEKKRRKAEKKKEKKTTIETVE